MHNLVSITPKGNSLTVRDATITVEGNAAHCRLRLVNSHVAIVDSENVVIEGLENSSISASNSDFRIAPYIPRDGGGISLIEAHQCSVGLSGDVFSHVIANECRTLMENAENMSIVVLGGTLSGGGGDTVRVFVDGGAVEGEFLRVEGIINGVEDAGGAPADAPNGEPEDAPGFAPENESTQEEEPTEIVDDESVLAHENNDGESVRDDVVAPADTPVSTPTGAPDSAPADAPTTTPQERHEDNDPIYTDVDGFTYKTLHPHKLGIHHTTTYATDEQLEANAPTDAPASTPTDVPDSAPDVKPFDITSQKTTKITLPWNNL